MLGWKLRTKGVEGVLERRERGITYRRGDETWSVAWDEVEAATLSEYPMMAPHPMARTRYRLLLRLKGGQSMAADAVLTGVGFINDPFVTWARAVEKTH